MLARNARGIAAVAATYALFLLHTQFGFLEQIRRDLVAPERVRGAMACMGIAGLIASGAAAWLARRTDAARLARGALAGAAAIAILGLGARGFVASCVAAAAIKSCGNG